MNRLSEHEALRVIKECADLYKTFLVNRKFLFVYRAKSGGYASIEVLFRPKHFLHLTGNERIEDLSSIHFYSKCVDNTISLQDIRKSDVMDLKLSVLPKLMKIHKNARMFGVFSRGAKPILYTEKLLGGERGCLGFTYDTEEGFLVPNTALNEDIRKFTQEQNQVVAVYSAFISSNKYKTICYIAKKSDIAKKEPSQLVWPNDIQTKLDLSALIIDL